MSPSGSKDGYRPISDYGLIGDAHSCALVSSDGSVDWACFPRFDSRSVFGRLLDKNIGGHFTVRPLDTVRTTRRYLPATNILETTFHTKKGTAVLTDFMPAHGHDRPGDPNEIFPEQQIGRILKCTSGSVEFEAVCQPRFDYGAIVPHAMTLNPHSGYAHGGADALAFYSSAPMEVEDNGFVARGRMDSGSTAYFSARYSHPTNHEIELLGSAEVELRFEDTKRFWEEWSAKLTYEGPYRDDVLRSVLTLKALTYAPTGGLVAAATTSLPEAIGGSRNWDYRYTWIRDATFALYALNIVGFVDEARAFKDWLERATAGRAADLQVMYGLGGERRLTEIELPHLEGYRRSRPVRIGNGAHSQFQLDIYGEVLDSAHLYRKYVGGFDDEYWEFCRDVAQFVMDHWKEPDDGIWETRGGRQHFVFSKVMCWVALHRAVLTVRDTGREGDVDRWRTVMEEIRQEVLEKGYDPEVGAFVQHYGSKTLDASNLMLPLVRFIKATDPRMRSTIEKTAQELTSPSGLVYRYRDYDDGIGGQEGAFTLCSFWLADNLILLGETDRARAMFENLLGHANDLGLFSEEVLPETGEMLGNFPQAFTHVAVINTAVQLRKAVQRAAV